MGEWAKELEQCYKQTGSVRGHPAPRIALSETLFIDQEGRRVLATLFHEGAFFRTACPMTESIVSEITRKPNGASRSVTVAVRSIAAGGWGERCATSDSTHAAALDLARRRRNGAKAESSCADCESKCRSDSGEPDCSAVHALTEGEF